MNHQREIFSCSQPFILESGKTLESFDIVYDTYGKLNANKDNVVLVFHAFSGSNHAAGKLESDDSIGWWDKFIGPNKAINTNESFVICANNIGSCFGSTGPKSVSNNTNKTYGKNFPEVSVTDWNNSIYKLLDSLNIKKVNTAIGASLGGMQVMDLISNKNKSTKKGIIIGASPKPRQFNILLNHVQRSILNLSDKPDALQVARMLSHISYISSNFIEEKFRYNLQKPESRISEDIKYESENYLSYHGKKFEKKFDRNSFRLMTKAMDSYFLDESKIKNIESKVLLISFDDDLLFPSKDMLEFHNLLKMRGIDSYHEKLKGTRGHDSFLYLTEDYQKKLVKFLKK
ncbi:MAG: homoserine O-acetyltransferase [SAR86 cluster bacterium]|nr:homoserine O-acetyltransferase [SAR86 cluster bacterium]